MVIEYNGYVIDVDRVNLVCPLVRDELDGTYFEMYIDGSYTNISDDDDWEHDDVVEFREIIVKRMRARNNTELSDSRAD